MNLPRARRRLDGARESWFARWEWAQQYRWVRFVATFMLLWGHRRAFGFSAEAAFWMTFTLPWLFLGLVSAVSAAARAFDSDVDDTLIAETLDFTEAILTPEAVNQYVVPLLDQALAGTGSLGMAGLIAALWSGSRVFVTFADGSARLNGAPKRSYLHSRVLAVIIYGLGLVLLALLIVSAVVAPDLWALLLGIAPGGLPVGVGLAALLLLVFAATSLLWLANPRRAAWWLSIPGGGAALLIWLLGSWGLQEYLSWLFREGTLYGAIAAPVAIMVWLLVTTMAVFVGVTLNATILVFRDVRRENEDGLGHRAQTALADHHRIIEMVSQPSRSRGRGSGGGGSGDVSVGDQTAGDEEQNAPRDAATPPRESGERLRGTRGSPGQEPAGEES